MAAPGWAGGLPTWQPLAFVHTPLAGLLARLTGPPTVVPPTRSPLAQPPRPRTEWGEMGVRGCSEIANSPDTIGRNRVMLVRRSPSTAHGGGGGGRRLPRQAACSRLSPFACAPDSSVRCRASNHAIPHAPSRPVPGQPLAPTLRARLERQMGANLGAVRLHTDSAADRVATSHRANAVTVRARRLLRGRPVPARDTDGLRAVGARADPRPAVGGGLAPVGPLGPTHRHALESEARTHERAAMLGMPLPALRTSASVLSSQTTPPATVPPPFAPPLRAGGGAGGWGLPGFAHRPCPRSCQPRSLPATPDGVHRAAGRSLAGAAAGDRDGRHADLTGLASRRVPRRGFIVQCRRRS